MEEKTNILEPLYEKVEEYSKTTFELIKLKAISKTAQVSANIISRTISILLFSMFFLLISFGISLWLGELLGKPYYGFLALGGFYALIGVVLYFFLHKTLKKSIANSIVSQIFN